MLNALFFSFIHCPFYFFTSPHKHFFYYYFLYFYFAFYYYFVFCIISLTSTTHTDPSSRNISEPLHGPRQTNQRAELMAIYRAIEIAPKHREVLIFSDSQYAIHCVTLWHHNWSRNNWKTTLGKPVENKDIIQEVLKMIQEREEIGARTEFEWVKGHTGERDGNSMADRLAVEGARKGKLMLGESKSNEMEAVLVKWHVGNRESEFCWKFGRNIKGCFCEDRLYELGRY